MYSPKPRAKRSTTKSDPFLGLALAETRQAGLHHVLLDQFTIQYQGRTFAPQDLVLSHPFLTTAASHVRLGDRRQSHGLAEDGFTTLRADKDRTVRQLADDVRSSRYLIAPPRVIEVPKLRYGIDINPEQLDLLWGPGCSGEQVGTRTLTVDPPVHRVLCTSVAIMLGHYFSRRWRSGVVGFRPGIGQPEILAAFQQAVTRTGRHHVLSLDIQDFFGSIDVPTLLNHLDGQTGYRRNQDLERIIEICLSNRPDHGLPQGNPLSPLLANLYGEQAVDRVAKQFGPAMRYADDLLVLVESEDQARAAYGAIQESGARFGLRLHPGKSRYHNLLSGESFSFANPTGPTLEPLVYLGVECKLGQEGLEFGLTNQAIRKLLESLRDTWFSPSPAGEHHRPVLLDRFRLARYRATGWMEAYGCCARTSEQEQAIYQILDLAHLTDPSIRRLLREVGPALHADQESRESLVEDVAGFCGMPKLRDAKRDLESLTVWGDRGIGRMLRQSRERYEKALRDPMDLPYRNPREPHRWRHTRPDRDGQHSDQGTGQEQGTIWGDDPEAPAPVGELLYRQGPPRTGDPRFPCSLDVVEYSSHL